jgi:uncharacterized phage infection (PIP) family protein YhgE
VGADHPPSPSQPDDAKVLKKAAAREELLKKLLAKSKRANKALTSLHKKFNKFAEELTTLMDVSEKAHDAAKEAHDAAEKACDAAGAMNETATALGAKMAGARALIDDMEVMAQGHIEGGERDASVESDEFDKCDESDEADEDDEYDKCVDLDENDR